MTRPAPDAGGAPGRATMARALLGLLLLCGTCVLGCGKAGGDPGSAELESTGVDACDGYLAAMLACAGKLPAETRKGHEAAIRIARDALEAKAEADDEALEGGARDEARSALAAACQQMSEAVVERTPCGG
ncbi:hypothetical protein [Sorangium sp. Soce836]|uniref:Uncharacterized protein n=2 Tax=Sorangium cellulosum TaxID=56 RepID=A0A4P2R0X1_SORCE|nr:hypothetical protein [Sorangium sp. Soce836]AUX36584.1 hypothetical protein SOCE836_087920 [Sorangium cellulosum]WCQ95882.1 hypothetical protein NQZ70_08659 [Sorangium sp. Soce836]